MFSSKPNYGKLKSNLNLAINRLKLTEKKKSEIALKARREIADYIRAGKFERARIRVEYIIREDYTVEALEMVEMYCELLISRYSIIEQLRDMDEGLVEAISSLMWVTPHLQTDVGELKTISKQLSYKYGKPYAQACREKSVSTINENLMRKLSMQSPCKMVVEKYLIEIANNFNVQYTPDDNLMQEGNWRTSQHEELSPLRDPKDGMNTNLSIGFTGLSEDVPRYLNDLDIGCDKLKPYDHTQTYPSLPYVSPLNPHPAYTPFNQPQPLDSNFVPSIFFTNPQSLTNSFDAFLSLSKLHKPDIMSVSETWFSDNKPASKFTMEGYSMFHDDREGKRGGGVAMYIKSKLKPEEPQIKVLPELEVIWAGFGSWFVCTIYHPPKAKSDDLMDHLVNTCLDLRARNTGCKIVIIGDFNHLPYSRLYASVDLRNLVLAPTHFNSNIDLIVTDVPHLFASPSILPPIGASKHNCVFVLPAKEGWVQN